MTRSETPFTRSAAAPTRSAAAPSALATASFLAFGALLVLYGANSTELIAALSLEYKDLGLVGSMLSLGLGIGIVAAGPIVDRWPRRPLFAVACTVVMLASTTLGAGTTFPALLVHTVAIGVGAGFYETVLNTIVVEEFEEQAPRRLVFIHSGATLAASVTPLLFDGLRGVVDLAWYDTFRLVGLVHVTLIAAVAFVPLRAPRSRTRGTSVADGQDAGDDGRGEERPRNTASQSDDPAARRDDGLALAAICATTFAYVGVEAALTIFVAEHAASDLGLDAGRAARTISAFWAGLLAGRLVIGLSPRAPGAGTTALLAAVAATAVLAFGLGWIRTPEIAMATSGFFLGGVFPVMIGLAGMAMPSSAGTAVGLAGGLGSLGGFVVPWFTGHIAGRVGLSIAIASLAGWLGLLVAAAAVARLRQGPGAPR